MTNTEQTKRDCMKLIKNRARRLRGGCSEFPQEAACSCSALHQNSPDAECQDWSRSQGNILWDSAKVWKNSHLFVFKAFFYLEPEVSGKPMWSFAKLRLLFQTQWLRFRNLWRPEICAWADKARCFILVQLAFPLCVYFKLWLKLHRKRGI